VAGLGQEIEDGRQQSFGVTAAFSQIPGDGEIVGGNEGYARGATHGIHGEHRRFHDALSSVCMSSRSMSAAGPSM
jgi:hypothetical protein